MDLSKATERIVKLGDNHVRVVLLLYTSKGEEVVVKSNSYGREGLNEERERETQKLNTINAYDKTSEAVEQQKRIDKINEIQTVMDC